MMNEVILFLNLYGHATSPI